MINLPIWGFEVRLEEVETVYLGYTTDAVIYLADVEVYRVKEVYKYEEDEAKADAMSDFASELAKLFRKDETPKPQETHAQLLQRQVEERENMALAPLAKLGLLPKPPKDK